MQTIDFSQQLHCNVEGIKILLEDNFSHHTGL